MRGSDAETAWLTGRWPGSAPPVPASRATRPRKADDPARSGPASHVVSTDVINSTGIRGAAASSAAATSAGVRLGARTSDTSRTCWRTRVSRLKPWRRASADAGSTARTTASMLRASCCACRGERRRRLAPPADTTRDGDGCQRHGHEREDHQAEADRPERTVDQRAGRGRTAVADRKWLLVRQQAAEGHRGARHVHCASRRRVWRALPRTLDVVACGQGRNLQARKLAAVRREDVAELISRNGVTLCGAAGVAARDLETPE